MCQGWESGGLGCAKVGRVEVYDVPRLGECMPGYYQIINVDFSTGAVSCGTLSFCCRSLSAVGTVNQGV